MNGAAVQATHKTTLETLPGGVGHLCTCLGCDWVFESAAKEEALLGCEYHEVAGWRDWEPALDFDWEDERPLLGRAVGLTKWGGQPLLDLIGLALTLAFLAYLCYLVAGLVK